MSDDSSRSQNSRYRGSSERGGSHERGARQRRGGGHLRNGSHQRGGPRRSGGNRPPKKTDVARNTAFDVLMNVEVDDGYANLLLPKLMEQRRISPVDRGLCTELTYGTLRMQGLYDQIIALNTTNPDLEAAVRVTLRLGAHQLLNMRIPDYAAVSQTVALARDRVGAGAGGLVNAVLRKIGEKDLDTWRAELSEGKSKATKIAIHHAHPEWIVRALHQSRTMHGHAADTLESLCASHNVPADVCLRIHESLTSEQELAEAGVETRSGNLMQQSRYLSGGNPGQIAALREGRISVQDEGSQLAAELLARVETTSTSTRWWDMCSGPGGKTAVLADFLASQASDITIVATELHEHRKDLVLQATRQWPGVEVVQADALEYTGKFAKILLDAPCTGIGALRRRPEARWRKQPQDVPALASLQVRLLSHAVQQLDHGGVCAYVTCSPHIAETINVVEDVVAKNDDLEVIDARQLAAEITGQTELFGHSQLPYVQLWSDIHHTDAMFVALLRKK